MSRTTPVTDFLVRLEVDSDFAKRVLDEDVQLRNAALAEYELDEEGIRTAIGSADFSELQARVLREHPDSDTPRILPKLWVA
jgi:hypothetical protein